VSKQQLPDEILDAVSGGVFTFQGETVTDMTYDERGMKWTAGGKSVQTSWSPKVKEWIAQNPGIHAMGKMVIEAVQASPNSVAMEDFDSWVTKRI